MISEQQTREERIKWWRDGKYGMFIHWGLYSIPAGVWKTSVQETGYSEWVMYGEKIPVDEYGALAGEFNPTRFDARAWVDVARRAGMKYVVFTTKHHDGFSMYDSDATPYNVVKATPWARDPARELADACREAGLRFGCYYSTDRDWYRLQGPGNHYKQTNVWDFPQSTREDFDLYIEQIVKPQIEELLVKYQPDLLWFDEINMKTEAQIEDLYQLIRRLRPECIINSRIKGCRFPEQIPPPYCDYISSGDNEIMDKALGFEWENPGSMNTSFGYNRNDHNWVQPDEVVSRLVDIVSKGGNYLLNVGPTADGVIPQPSVDHLLAAGAWLETNRKAIYGTSVWKCCHEKTDDGLMDIRFTTKDNALYAICLTCPQSELLIKALGHNGSLGKPVTAVSMLGSTEAIRWQQRDDGLSLSVPQNRPCRFAPVYRITCNPA